MKLSAQQKKMGEIYTLLRMDLTYIYGERESGPNGAKKVFLDKSAAFLRRLGKDLGFSEMRVCKNPAGIGCSGSVSLYGMWGEGNGICFVLEEPIWSKALLYREITSLTDYTGKANHWLPIAIFLDMDYKRLCSIMLAYRKEANQNAA